MSRAAPSLTQRNFLHQIGIDDAMISTIKKEQKLGAISKEEAAAALDTVLELNVECVLETPRLCRAAFKWATLMNQTAAYDGFYLALAEEWGSSLWTGDGRLVRRAHQIDVPWVRFIGDV